MKDPIKKTLMTVEHHCLDLAYAPIRLYQRGKLNNLTASIEQQGQLVPVIIVAKDQQWVLIDGYLRLKALQRLGEDTIAAEVWECDLAQALLFLLAEHQSRVWEALEEAMLLRELQTQHGLAQGAIAASIGRDRSWVCRRLALIEHMPEFILQAILKGTLSLWAAQRVLAPVARATPEHAEKLLSYLIKNHHSTRELQSFYEHYKRTHHQERSRMINEPGLFFKAQKMLRIEKDTKYLKEGPEGQWQSSLNSITWHLKQLITLAPQVFIQQECHQLLNAFYQAKTNFDLLTEALGGFIDANERNSSSSFGIASERKESPHYQSAS